MSGRPSRESIMLALLASLQGSLQTSFTADTSDGSATLANVSSLAGLYQGLPVFGAGIASLATIATLSPFTLSLPATATAAAVPMVSGVQTFGRRLTPWGQIAAQPALFLRDPDEDLEYANIIMQRQTISAEVWFASDAGKNPEAVPGAALNYLLDALQAAFAPDDPSRGRFTIGGLVEWCRMSGKIIKDSGDLGTQAIAVAEVLITVP